MDVLDRIAASRKTLKRGTLAGIVLLASMLVGLKMVQYAFENGHGANHRSYSGVVGRVDDPSFWMFLAALISVALVLEGSRRPRPASPLRNVREGRDLAALFCWLSIIPMATVYTLEIWYTGEAMFQPKATGWRWELENTATTRPFGPEHLIQICDSLLTFIFIVLGCATAAYAVRRLGRGAEILNRSSDKSAAFIRLARPISLIASAGLGPVTVCALWWAAWRLLRRFPWLGGAQAPTKKEFVGIVLSIFFLCLPYFILYITVCVRLTRPYRFRHRLLKLIWIGSYGAWLTCWVKGRWGGPIDGRKGWYILRVTAPDGQEKNCPFHCGKQMKWTVDGASPIAATGFTARLLPRAEIELRDSLAKMRLRKRLSRFWRDYVSA